jgi:hypothetical protein
MTQEAPQMPQPTAEHAYLTSHAGTWKVACQFFMEPGQPPMETTATETIEKVGEFWTVSRYQTEMMGAPFVGRATLGFEPHTGQYVSTWVDSMNPVLCTMRGTKKGETLELQGKWYSCMTNSELVHRTVEKTLSKDEHVFEMYCTLPDGTEILMMRNHYRRA